jgi:hypothetical protein
MPKIKCLQCNREYIKKKNSKEICGICVSKNKKLKEQLINIQTERYKRTCPTCSSKIVYKNEKRYLKALESNCKCKTCTAIKQFKDLDKQIKLGLKENGFKGKTHSEEVKSVLKKKSTGRKHSEETKLKISYANSGENSIFYGKSLYEIQCKKYGVKIAKKKRDDRIKKLSIKNTGSGNPMYGKPSPQGSGNGWSGWYKDIYFRSFLELSFLVNWVNRFKLDIESAEKKKYRIQYNFNGAERNYFADWIVNGKYLVEIKPKRLWNTPQNKAKFEAAREYCKENILIFKIIEPIKLSKDEIRYLYETNQVMFNKKYNEKFKNY